MDAEGRILVAVVDKTIYVKPIGYATQDNSLGLPDFLRAMFRQGCTSVTFDLDECRAMDSTFLGVVASAAMSGPHGRGKSVLIINANAEAKRELKMIGLLPVVALREDKTEPPPDLELSRIDFVHLPNDERERIERIKELHEELIKLNEQNRQNFGNFIEMLDEELKNTD